MWDKGCVCVRQCWTRSLANVYLKKYISFLPLNLCIDMVNSVLALSMSMITCLSFRTATGEPVLYPHVAIKHSTLMTVLPVFFKDIG